MVVIMTMSSTRKDNQAQYNHRSKLAAAVLSLPLVLAIGLKRHIRHGVLFEVPSACLQAQELLAAADFGSIGTNDLIQYLFALDRNNDLVAYDYSPDKPVFWQLIKQIVKAANKTGQPLSVCGETASRRRYLPKLMELGIDTVSVSPRLISDLRCAVRTGKNDDTFEL